MPDMSGIELTKEIRRIEKEQKTMNRLVLIGMSGYDDYKIKAKGRNSGMNDVYLKPVSKDVLK